MYQVVFKNSELQSSANDESVIDTGSGIGYNNSVRSEKYEPTDEFRNLQAESRGMSDEDTKLYHSGDREIDEGIRERFSRGVRSVFLDSRNNGLRNGNGLLNLNSKGNQFNIYEGVNGSLFHDVFEMAKKYLKHGELVDLHGIQTTEDGIGYNDCYNYLSEDGLSGFSITPDGDLISVFNASGKSGFLRAIAPIVKEKAKTLDCYNSPNQPLMNMYSTLFGFKAASVMDYNMEFDHDNIAENHALPQIAFMVNTDEDVETRAFSKDEYTQALEYRNSFVKADSKESASFMPESESGIQISELDLREEKVDWLQKIGDDLVGYGRKTEGQKIIIKAAAKLGWKIGFANVYVRDKNNRTVFENGQPKRADSRVNKAKKEIVFDYECKNPVKELLKHELTHFLETNISAYQDFANGVMNSKVFKSWISEKGYNSTGEYNKKIQKDYKGAKGFESADSAEYSANLELVAQFVAEKLFKNEQSMLERLITEMTPKQRIKLSDFVHNVIAKIKNAFKGLRQEQEIEQLETMWLKTYKKAETTWQENQSKTEKNTADDSDVEYAIGYTVENNPVAIVESDVLAGVPKSQWVKTIKNTLSGKFSNGIPISGRLIKVNKKSREEYTNSKYSKYLRDNDSILYEDKLKSADNLDEIILATTNYINEDLKHARNDSFKEFARGDVLIRVGNNDYSAKVIVGFTHSKEMVLYDIIGFNPTSFKLKKEGLPNGHKTIRSGNPSIDSITNKNESVNNNSTQNDEEYSIAEAFMDNSGNQYDNAVLLDTNFFDGLSPRNWGRKLKEFVYSRSSSSPFIMPVVDENGNRQQVQFASPEDRTTKNGASNHKVIDKLLSSSDNISKLAVLHIDEIVAISEENNPYYTNEHNHQWLDKNGWLHRNVNVVNKNNGNIYNLTIDIAKTEDGRMILYATNGKIKKVGNVQVNSLKIRGSGLNTNFNDSITNKNNSVNSNSTKGDKGTVLSSPFFLTFSKGGW